MTDREKLSDTKRKEFDANYEPIRKQLPNCPKCNTNVDVIPSVRGKPSHDLLLYAEEGHVRLSGCTQSHKGWCKKCAQFI
ncbi:hypothetical protein I4U23_002912 [Adineta vaga]|nr:hypothetical protein I4U23_002912 [Adineta vaga]